MNNSFSKVDEMLCILIDPEKKTLTEDEVDYQHFDLNAIDSEWQNSLYK